jgi:hypothetical protein
MGATRLTGASLSLFLIPVSPTPMPFQDFEQTTGLWGMYFVTMELC